MVLPFTVGKDYHHVDAAFGGGDNQHRGGDGGKIPEAPVKDKTADPEIVDKFAAVVLNSLGVPYLVIMLKFRHSILPNGFSI